MRILAVGTTSAMARVASMPLIFGMRTSMRITSGAASSALAHGLLAVLGLGDDLDARLRTRAP